MLARCRVGAVTVNDDAENVKAGDLIRNVLHAIQNWPDPDTKLDVIAKRIGVSPSTINRWKRDATLPSPNSVRMLAKCVGVDAVLFDEPHEKYLAGVDSKSSFMRRDWKNVQQRIMLGPVVKWKHLWDECFERHEGSYFLYNRLGKIVGNPENTDVVAVALLTVERKTDRGVEFELHNIDDRHKVTTGKSIHYVYKGLMFPVFDTMCFYGEEQSGDELLTIVTAYSQKSPPSMLSGYLAAVGVNAQTRIASGAKVLLVFKGKKHLAVSDIEAQLGLFPKDRIARDILEQI